MTDVPSEPATRNVLVNAKPSDFVIQIPTSWKLTFSAVNPSTPTGGGGYHGNLHCLRVYEGQAGEESGKLRAVYCDVMGFRDLSIPLIRKVEKQTGSAEWTEDSEGNFEHKVGRQIEASWSEPEAVDVPF